MNITIEAMADAMAAGSEPFRDALVRVVADHRAMAQTLTATQQRCSDLLNRARQAEAELKAERACRIDAETERDMRLSEIARLLIELDEAKTKVEEQRRQLTVAQQNNHKRNVQLDALRFVWCTGGCEGGMSRWSGETITEAIVSEAVRNTQRMVSWYLNHRSRNGADRGELDGLSEKWRLTSDGSGPQLSAAIAAYRAEPTPRACRMLDEFGYLRAKAVLDAVVADGGAEERDVAELSSTPLRQQVIAFHRAMGQPVLDKPQVPSDDRIRLRLRMMAEEFCELLEACFPAANATISKIWTECDYLIETRGFLLRPNIVKVADALADLDFLSEGTRLEFGINGKPLADEVFRSNMSKEPAEPGSNGKIKKGPNYSPPQIERLLREQGWEG